MFQGGVERSFSCIAKRLISFLLIFLISINFFYFGITPNSEALAASVDEDAADPDGSAKCVHVFGEWKTIREATCTKTGTKVQYCEKCGYENEGSIPAKGHDEVVTGTTPATCSSGKTTYYKCRRCGTTRSETDKKVDKTNHPNGKTTTIAATCIKEGSESFECPDCHLANSKTLPKDPENHVNISGWKTKKAATCEESGLKCKKCKDCGKETDTKKTDPLGHSWSKYTTKDPTCSHKGKAVRECEREGCSATESQSLEKDPNNHEGPLHWETVDKGDCTHRGKEREICDACGKPTGNENYFDVGHDWIWEEQLPTCSSPGYKGYRCACCDLLKSGYQNLPIDLNNHNFVLLDKEKYELYDDMILVIDAVCSWCETARVSQIIVYTPHYHSFDKYYGDHTSQGHRVTYVCDCGESRDGGWETLDTCPACSGAPEIALESIRPGEVLACGTFDVTVHVRDNENDTITCKYYIDGSEQPADSVTVSDSANGRDIIFPVRLDASLLEDGVHTLRITAEDPVSPAGKTEVSFTVDKAAPVADHVIVSAEEYGIRIDVSAHDETTEITGFRYILDGSASDIGDFTDRAFAEFGGLVPNTRYSYTVQIRDTAGNVDTVYGLCSTEPDMGEIIPIVEGGCSFKLIITDDNPSDTIYRIRTAGTLLYEGTAAPTDIYGEEKEIRLPEAVCGTENTFSVSVVGRDGNERSCGEFAVSDGMNPIVLTGPKAPEAEGVLFNGNGALITWTAVENARYYEIEIDGISYNAGTALNYLHEELEPGSVHEYRVRAVSAFVKGSYSELIALKTMPEVPDVPDSSSILIVSPKERTTYSVDPIIGPINPVQPGDSSEIQGGFDDNADADSQLSISRTLGNILADSVNKADSECNDEAYSVEGITTEDGINFIIPDLGDIENPAADDRYIIWEPVPGAEYYDIEINGKVTENIRDTWIKLEGYSAKIRLRAGNEAGVSEWSSQYSCSKRDVLTASEYGRSTPSAPLPVMSAVGKTYIILEWEKDENASHYEVYINSETVVTVLDSRAVIMGLNPGTSYLVKVRACTRQPGITEEAGYGCDAYSESSDICVTTLADASSSAEGAFIDAVPELPENIAVMCSAGKQFTVNLPVNCAQAGMRYSFSFSWTDADVELTDLWTPTKKKETDDLTAVGGRTFLITHEDGRTTVRIICECRYDCARVLAASMRFVSRTDDQITMEFGEQ